MQLRKDNLEIYAARHYTNSTCASREEFQEDLERFRLARKLAKKVANNKSANIRLLLNHVIGFTNNFELPAAKNILMFDATDGEKGVLKTVLNYLGHINKNEMADVPHSMETAMLLKEMDR